MAIVQTLATLAVQQVLGDSASVVVGLLVNHFTDQGQRLQHALHKANDRAWKALEIALAGDSWWEQIKHSLACKEDRVFGQQVRSFLEALPVPELAGKSQFRKQCLQELQQARSNKVLTGGKLAPEHLARQAGALPRSDPQAILTVQWHVLQGVGQELRSARCSNLAWLIEQRPRSGTPLLVLAVRYFFRREVETDPELACGMVLTQLDHLGEGQEAAFQNLDAVLRQQGERLEGLLLDVHGVVEQTRQTAQNIEQELRQQGRQIHELSQVVHEALARHHLERRELRPRDTLSIQNESERQLVKQLVGQFRSLPDERRKQLPALLSSLAMLQVATGEFEAARHDFQTVACLVDDPQLRAEAHYNAYRSALEQRDWEGALEELLNAAKLAPKRFAPFPVGRYLPRRILGAGGFGVAFLCQHKFMSTNLVVKSLLLEDLDRDVENVFSEARLLSHLDDPALVRIWDCGYVDSAAKSRPYLVLACYRGPDGGDGIHLLGPLAKKVVRIAPPLVLTEAEAKAALELMFRSLAPLAEGGKQPARPAAAGAR